jgi:hypothetical protein
MSTVVTVMFICIMIEQSVFKGERDQLERLL